MCVERHSYLLLPRPTKHCADFTAQEPHRCLSKLSNCYHKYLKYVESFSCLKPSFRFPFSWRSKREESTLSVSARKQMDTSVHAQLSRLSPLLPLDPSRGSRDTLSKMAKKDLLFFAFDFVQCSKCMFQPFSVCTRRYHWSQLPVRWIGGTPDDEFLIIMFNLKVFYIKWYCDFLKRWQTLSVLLPSLCLWLGSFTHCLFVVCHHYENPAIILYDFSELVSLMGFSYDYTLKFQTTQR